MKLLKLITRIVLVTIIFAAFLRTVNAQFVNNGASVAITKDAILYTSGPLTNTDSGTIINNGSIITDSSIINDPGASLSGNGRYVMQVNFNNKGIFYAGTSTLEFTGALNSSIRNKTGEIHILQIAKDSNKYVNLLDDEKILDSIIFVNDNNWLRLGSNTLTLDTNCIVEDYSNKRFIITNDSGFLKKIRVMNTAFTFPVGFDKNTYNPLTITEKGTPDNYSVRCLQYALLNGSSGNPVSAKGINVSWIVNQGTGGGANTTIKAQWKNTDHLAGFNYYKCMVVRYTANGWDYKANLADTATGNTYKNISRAGLSTFGYFTVLSGNPTLTNNLSVAAINAIESNSSNNKQFKVYPTIVQNNLNIEVPFSNKSSGKMTISITDGTGKTVWQKQNADYATQRIFLPNLPAGMYNVMIEFDNERFIEKIVIGR